MLCDTCIHKEVCYESEENRLALVSCSDYIDEKRTLFKVNVEYFDGSNVENCDYGYYDDYEKAKEVADKIKENCFIRLSTLTTSVIDYAVKCPIANVTINEIDSLNRPFMPARFTNE